MQNVVQESTPRMSRRLFMRRGSLVAAGGLVVGGMAVPGWARWLGEQMEKLQPKPWVEIRPAIPQWTSAFDPVFAFDPEGAGGLQAAIEDLREQLRKKGLIKNTDVPDSTLRFRMVDWDNTVAMPTPAMLALTHNFWFGLKEA